MKDRVCAENATPDTLASAIVIVLWPYSPRSQPFEQERILRPINGAWFSSLRKIRLVLVFGFELQLLN